MAAAAPDIETQCQDAEKDQGVALHLHKDNLSAATLNLKDEYGTRGDFPIPHTTAS